MSSTLPVWLASILPIIGLCLVVASSFLFFLPKKPTLFLRMLGTFVIPWVFILILRHLGINGDLLISLCLSIGVAWTYSGRIWPLLVAALLTCISIFGRLGADITLTMAFVSSLVGILSGFGVHILENRFDVFESIVRLYRHEMEYRRQTMHLLVGVCITLGMYYGILHTVLLGILIPVSLIFIHLVKKRKLPFLEKALLIFERKHHFEKFPGRGSLCFLIGAFLASLLFTREIAMASVLILAFGDSITNIAGSYFGKISLPYNPQKKAEGPAAGAILSAFAASIFVPLPIAFVASIGAMFVETLPLHFLGYDIDDNITIPVAAGILMTIFL